MYITVPMTVMPAVILLSLVDLLMLVMSGLSWEYQDSDLCCESHACEDEECYHFITSLSYCFSCFCSYHICATIAPIPHAIPPITIATALPARKNTICFPSFRLICFLLFSFLWLHHNIPSFTLPLQKTGDLKKLEKNFSDSKKAPCFVQNAY